MRVNEAETNRVFLNQHVGDFEFLFHKNFNTASFFLLFSCNNNLQDKIFFDNMIYNNYMFNTYEHVSLHVCTPGHAHTQADPAGKPCTKVQASKPCYERIKFKVKYVINKLSMKMPENLNLSLNLKH